MVVQRHEVSLVELERRWELLRQLPHAVQKLREHGRQFLGVDTGDETTAVGELVTERQPVLLQQRLHARTRAHIHTHIHWSQCLCKGVCYMNMCSCEIIFMQLSAITLLVSYTSSPKWSSVVSQGRTLNPTHSFTSWSQRFITLHFNRPGSWTPIIITTRKFIRHHNESLQRRLNSVNCRVHAYV